MWQLIAPPPFWGAPLTRRSQLPRPSDGLPRFFHLNTKTFPSTTSHQFNSIHTDQLRLCRFTHRRSLRQPRAALIGQQSTRGASLLNAVPLPGAACARGSASEKDRLHAATTSTGRHAPPPRPPDSGGGGGRSSCRRCGSCERRRQKHQHACDPEPQRASSIVRPPQGRPRPPPPHPPRPHLQPRRRAGAAGRHARRHRPPPRRRLSAADGAADATGAPRRGAGAARAPGSGGRPGGGERGRRDGRGGGGGDAGQRRASGRRAARDGKRCALLGGPTCGVLGGCLGIRCRLLIHRIGAAPILLPQTSTFTHTLPAFSVALGIPTPTTDPDFLAAACDVIAGGYAVRVDMALVTTSEVGNRESPDASTKRTTHMRAPTNAQPTRPQVSDAPCILLAGVGFEAEVVAAAPRGLKDALGPAAYLLAGGAKLLQQRGNFRARVRTGCWGWGWVRVGCCVLLACCTLFEAVAQSPQSTTHPTRHSIKNRSPSTASSTKAPPPPSRSPTPRRRRRSSRTGTWGTRYPTVRKPCGTV
jgi:hypothetical protein